MGEADGPDENPISALFPRPSGLGKVNFVLGIGLDREELFEYEAYRNA